MKDGTVSLGRPRQVRGHMQVSSEEGPLQFPQAPEQRSHPGSLCWGGRGACWNCGREKGCSGGSLAPKFGRAGASGSPTGLSSCLLNWLPPVALRPSHPCWALPGWHEASIRLQVNKSHLFPEARIAVTLYLSVVLQERKNSLEFKCMKISCSSKCS